MRADRARYRFDKTRGVQKKRNKKEKNEEEEEEEETEEVYSLLSLLFFLFLLFFFFVPIRYLFRLGARQLELADDNN